MDVINLPTGGQQSGISDRAHHTVTVAGQARGRYVCVHPALLASIACCCLIDDEKKSFRSVSTHAESSFAVALD